MASLWVFLSEHGVEATNNRAERALRFGVLWRKRSSGTASAKGNRWVERILSLRQTCRQLGQSSFGVLVDALSSALPAALLAAIQRRNISSSSSLGNDGILALL
jgi:transposase